MKFEFEQHFDQHFLKWHLAGKKANSLRLPLPVFHFVCQGTVFTCSVELPPAKGESTSWEHVQYNTKYTAFLKLDLTSTSQAKTTSQKPEKESQERKV